MKLLKYCHNILFGTIAISNFVVNDELINDFLMKYYTVLNLTQFHNNLIKTLIFKRIIK